MEQVNVLVVAQVGDADLERIAAVDPRVNVLDGRAKFKAEIRQAWPAETVRRYLGPADAGAGGPGSAQAAEADLDALLREAEVVCVGFPFPTNLASRAPRLKWLHQTPAGASNLRRGDIWGSSALVTTSRAYGNSTAHAEWVLAAMLVFAKGMMQAIADKQEGAFDRRRYRLRLFAGETVGIVGFGGIGKEVGRLARAMGLRVLGIRRSVSSRVVDAEGADVLFPPAELHQLLAESDFVVVTAQSTPETDKLIDGEALRAMKPTSYLINVARGEIIDEAALIEALREGTIAGAALDVYENEFDSPPNPELLRMPNVIFTPHISGGTDVPTHRGIELFCENLSRFLSGRELLNLVDWERGY